MDDVFSTRALGLSSPSLTNSDELLSGRLLKSASPAGSKILEDASSKLELLQHPYDLVAAAGMRTLNGHHVAALELVPDLIVGDGLRDPKVDDVLSPLCASGCFETEMAQVADDRNHLGWGVLEIVREPGNLNDDAPIRGIHAIRPQFTYLTRPTNSEYAMRVDLTGLCRAGHLDGTPGGSQIINNSAISYSPGGLSKPHAPFGKRQEFFKAFNITDPEQQAATSEYILFNRRGNTNEGYSMPRWLAAAAYVELNLQALNYASDFYYNSGAPAWMLFAMGGAIDRRQWADLQDEVAKNHTGLGNRFRGLMANIPGKDVKVQLEQLETPAPSDGFAEQSQEIGANILSAHGIPPKLAGALVAGKLGSTNDVATDLLLLETTRISRERRLLSKVLARTLGTAEGLTPKSFWDAEAEEPAAFKPSFDAETIATMSGVTRQTDPVGSGRDPQEGAAQNGKQRAQQANG